MEKCKYPNEACANMKFFHGNTYCDSFPCVLKEELPKQSNADKIRAMSDEELAEFINGFSTICELCKFNIGCSNVESVKCKNGILQWLQSEAE